MDPIVHFEIPAAKLSRAGKFYSSVFGWQITPAPQMETMYHMATTTEMGRDRMPKKRGELNGSLMTRDRTGKYPVLVIRVPSVDSYAKKVQKAGGKVVMPKQKVMGMGWYVRVADTEGNVIGIWEEIKKS